MATKISGRRLNLTHTLDGAWYSRVKKSLKKRIRRLTRARLKHNVGDE